MSFKNKLLSGFIIYGILLTSITIFTIYNINKSNLKIANIDNAIQKYSEKKEFFNYHIKHIELKLKTLKNSELFKYYLAKGHDEHHHINDLFLTIAGSSSNIMQLRYIDSNGLEKIRIDKKGFDSTPFVVSKEKLQNKFSRYYFKDVFAKNKNELWYSKIDLNMERGKIEKPIKPVLRVGTPIFNNNKKVGILIINIFMQKLLEKFSQGSLYDIYLIDKDGDFISHPNSAFAWNKYLKNGHNIKNTFPNIYNKIQKNGVYKDENLYAKKLHFNNNDHLKMIIKPKLLYIKNKMSKEINNLLIVMFIVLLLSLPFAYIFAKGPLKLKEEVDSLNKVLEEKEQFSNTVIESNINAIVVVDEEQTVLVFNQAAEIMFGYTKEEMLYKKSLENIIPKHYWDQHITGISNFIKVNTSTPPINRLHEVEGKRKNGEIFPILIGMGAKVENKHILIAANISDITVYKEQQHQIKKKDQILQHQSKLASMGEMIGSIAHQWRQPLNALNVNIENLEFDYDDGLVDKEFLDKFILEQTKTLHYMSKTIDDFRNFFRIDKKKTNFSIKKAVENSINIQVSEIRRYNITLNIHGDDFIVDGFENEFLQVIMNLISNAKDAIVQKNQNDGQIDISLLENKITIEDNAGGIPFDIIDRIFEPYYTTKEQGKGTGMGLYMSKMIIEDNMGGKITVSNAKNGAIFTIKLG